MRQSRGDESFSCRKTEFFPISLAEWIFYTIFAGIKLKQRENENR